jgi:hypothetical protein
MTPTISPDHAAAVAGDRNTGNAKNHGKGLDSGPIFAIP